MDFLVPLLIIAVLVVGLAIKIKRDRPHSDGDMISYDGWATGNSDSSSDSGSSND